MALALDARQRGLDLGHPLARLRHREHATRQLGLGLLDLTLGHRQASLGGIEGGRGRRRGRIRHVEVALGDIPRLHQALHPVLLSERLLGRATGAGHLGAHGGHGRPLRLHLGARFVHRRLARPLGDPRPFQRGPGLVGLRAGGLARELRVGPRRLEAGGGDGHRGPRLVADRVRGAERELRPVRGVGERLARVRVVRHRHEGDVGERLRRHPVVHRGVQADRFDGPQPREPAVHAGSDRGRGDSPTAQSFTARPGSSIGTPFPRQCGCEALNVTTIAACSVAR